MGLISYFDLKIYAVIVDFIIADYTMTNTQFDRQIPIITKSDLTYRFR